MRASTRTRSIGRRLSGVFGVQVLPERRYLRMPPAARFHRRVFRTRRGTGSESARPGWVTARLISGSNGEVSLFGSTTDAGGNILVAGLRTAANFYDDVFLRKYSPVGVVLSEHQYGTPMHDSADSLSAGIDGSVWVAGSTEGTFPGNASRGGRDAFVMKLDPTGTIVWTRQFGSVGGQDVFLASLDASGNMMRVRQVGTNATEEL